MSIILRFAANLASVVLGTVAVYLGDPASYAEFGAYAVLAAAVGSVVSGLIRRIQL